MQQIRNKSNVGDGRVKVLHFKYKDQEICEGIFPLTPIDENVYYYSF